jgi:hypothetical protein
MHDALVVNEGNANEKLPIFRLDFYEPLTSNLHLYAFVELREGLQDKLSAHNGLSAKDLRAEATNDVGMLHLG